MLLKNGRRFFQYTNEAIINRYHNTIISFNTFTYILISLIQANHLITFTFQIIHSMSKDFRLDKKPRHIQMLVYRGKCVVAKHSHLVAQ